LYAGTKSAPAAKDHHMSTVAEARPIGRTPAAIAKAIPSCRIDGPTHPATITRWIMRGVRLRDGSRLRLAATRSPGGWLVTDDAIEHFLAALTADRLGEPAPAPPSATAARQRELARVHAELNAAGF
jgi:hypothetical protein